MPRTQVGQIEWMGNLAAKLPVYAERLGLTEEDVETIRNGHAYLAHVLAKGNALKLKLRAWTTHKDEAMRGARISAPLAEPEPDAPVAPMPDIMGKARNLVKRIKVHPKYTNSIGRDLRLIGPEIIDDDVLIRPNLQVSLRAGFPSLKWLRQRTDSMEIVVDRGTGTFQHLITTTNNSYRDTSPLPPPGTAAAWHYKAIYRRKDEAIGQWSDIKTVTVLGA